MQLYLYGHASPQLHALWYDNFSVKLIGSDSLPYELYDGEFQPIYTALDLQTNVSYIPNENYNGPDSFKYKVNDGQFDSPEATVDISVLAVDDPIVILPPANRPETDEDTNITIKLAAQDVDNPIEFTITQQPTWGTISAQDGNCTSEGCRPQYRNYTFSPNSSLLDEHFGQNQEITHIIDTFEYKAMSSSGELTATVDIRINNIADT